MSMRITFGITDWAEENLRAEENATTLDDLVALAVDKGYSTAQLFKMHVVQRQMGLVKDDVIPANKQIFQNGGTGAIGLAFRRRKREIEINAKKYRIREMVGPIAQDGGQSQDGDHKGQAFESVTRNGGDVDENLPTTWQILGTPGACDLAWHYLQHCIPGHIMSRLLTIHESGGDVKEIIDWLHDKLDELANDLLREPGKA